MNNHISVKATAGFSGYSLQYLRRLLRPERLAGIKVGQVWLIEKDASMAYLEKVVRTTDRRFAPPINTLENRLFRLFLPFFRLFVAKLQQDQSWKGDSELPHPKLIDNFENEIFGLLVRWNYAE